MVDAVRYKVDFQEDAISDIEKIDKVIAQRILDKIKWLSENFLMMVPQPLKGKYKGFFKLRVGDWRVIYEFDNHEKTIKIHIVKHRREVY